MFVPVEYQHHVPIMYVFGTFRCISGGEQNLQVWGTERPGLRSGKDRL